MSERITHRAALKHPDGSTQTLALVRAGRGNYQWFDKVGQVPWVETVYLTDSNAIRAIRVYVDGDPSMVGVDLTITAAAEPPDVRAANLICANDATSPDVVADIIDSETNVNGLTRAFSELMAYCFTRRPAFAVGVALMTGQAPQPNAQHRDLAFDGLLLAAIEALAKATQEDYSNLTAKLKEPVSQLMVMKGSPEKGVTQ